jgi:hypothetical protein
LLAQRKARDALVGGEQGLTGFDDFFVGDFHWAHGGLL